MSTDPTVFIVEDDEAVSSALQLLFESVKLNVETFPDGHTYLEKHDPKRHGCLIIDMRMPGMSGLELQEQLNKRGNPLSTIFISGHADIPMAVRAIKAGALDFVTKPFHSQSLLELVQKAILQDTQRKEVLPLTEITKRYEQLTQREREVMKLVVEGKLNKQIADTLSIAASTVEIHRAHVMQKMQVRSVAALVKLSLSLEV